MSPAHAVGGVLDAPSAAPVRLGPHLCRSIAIGSIDSFAPLIQAFGLSTALPGTGSELVVLVFEQDATNLRLPICISASPAALDRYPRGLTGHVAHPGSLHSELKLTHCPARSPLPIAALPSVSPIPSARLPILKRLGDLCWNLFEQLPQILKHGVFFLRARAIGEKELLAQVQCLSLYCSLH